MTIASEIQKLITNLANSYTAARSKGATIPEDQNFDNLAACIDTIENAEPSLETLSVTPTTSQQVFTPTADGYSEVTVAGVTAAIDADIQAANIKSGVDILGVTGTVVELDGETKTYSFTDASTVSSVTLTPTSPHNAITSATVDITAIVDAIHEVNSGTSA